MCSSLVNHDFPPEFREFMASSGIRHCIVEMQGTKRVEIPDNVMNSIMEIALNKENHPLLIHCNHGKVRLYPHPSLQIHSGHG